MELASRIQRFVEHAHSQKQKQMAITESWKKMGWKPGKGWEIHGLWMGFLVFMMVFHGQWLNTRPGKHTNSELENGHRHSCFTH